MRASISIRIACLVLFAISQVGSAAAQQQRPSGPAKPPTTRPGGAAAPLTATDCRDLGCTIVEDKTCAAVISSRGRKFQVRCVCQGGGNACIDEVSAQ
jgi:hypothetical protein